MSLLINGKEVNHIHFVGILGSGMSALAQYLCWKGFSVSGSDRSLRSDATAIWREYLLKIGCTLFDQDGSGITEKIDAVCISSAIESDNPDLIAAQKYHISLVHRSDVLASIVNNHTTIAVAGTSGKSTVTAMIFEFLTTCNKSPSLITGAGLKRLEQQGYIGNAFSGTSDILVIEADESDGSLIKYHPDTSLFLNVSKDHKTVVEVKQLFKQLAQQSKRSIHNADDPLFNDFTTTGTFSLTTPSDWYPNSFSTTATGGVLTRNGIEYFLPLPGNHNLSNCAAALSVAELFGCTASQLQQATKTFEGVARRFTVTHTANNITIVDDFAHNPEKIRAAVTAARSISQRIIAIYQPHGFGPTRFLRDEYAKLFPLILKNDDILILLPIYYAGGTATKDISAIDLKNDLSSVDFSVYTQENRDVCLLLLQKEVQSGTCILVMGARDPSLPLFVKNIIDIFDI